MVQTRNQRRQDAARRIQGAFRSANRSTLWDSLGNSEAMEQLMQRARRQRWIKRYKPHDTAHRHRLEDDQDKDVHVTSYSRRS